MREPESQSTRKESVKRKLAARVLRTYGPFTPRKFWLCLGVPYKFAENPSGKSERKINHTRRLKVDLSSKNSMVKFDTESNAHNESIIEGALKTDFLRKNIQKS